MNRLYVIVVSNKNLRRLLIIFVFAVSFFYIGSTFLFEEKTIQKGFSKYSGEDSNVKIPKIVPLVFDKKTFFKILPENGCTNETNVLIGIFSKPNESSIRKFIRNNWGQDKYLGSKKKLIFVIAEDQDVNTNNELMEENQNFYDILQLDFDDHYYNLSLKTFGLLNYASGYCNHINCLLKADSDTTVNLIGLDQLCNYFDLTHEHESLIIGQIQPNTHKNMIKNNTYHIFANITSTKCVSGSLYFLYGKGISKKLVTSLESTPFFDVEDYRHLPENLIFTGILREYTKIDIRDIGGFACCGRISFWCNEVLNSSQISIGFENGRLTKEHAWDRMQKAIDGYYHEQCNVSQQKNYITANYHTSWMSAGMSNMEYPGDFLLEDNTTPISLDHKLFRGFPTKNKGCDDNTSLLIGVISKPSEFNTRSKIRRKFLGQIDKTKMIFLLGNTSSSKADFDVMAEEQKHGDILKLNILENYRNLTLKTYGLISYADKYCKNVKCVVKMDTDVEVNVEKLEDLCQSVPDNEQMITGHIYENPGVLRNISSKWYVPHYVYSDNIYPNFTYGPIYVLSGYGILPQMLKTLQEETPFFNSENYRRLSEDVIFTGIVREKAGIKIQDKALKTKNSFFQQIFINLQSLISGRSKNTAIRNRRAIVNIYR